MIYPNRERVTIHSLGIRNPELFRAIVVGYQPSGYISGDIYLVKLVDKLAEVKYDVIGIPAACLRRGWPGTKTYIGQLALEMFEQ
jgi:hypothetical protein